MQELLFLVLHPVPVHLCKEYGSIFFTPSHQAFVDSSKIPLCLLFSRLSRTSSLSISSYVLCSIPDHLGGLPWSLVHQCLSYTRELNLDPALAEGFLPVQSKGQGSLILPCWLHSEDTALDAFALLCHKLLSRQLTLCPGELGYSFPDTELYLTTHIYIC